MRSKLRVLYILLGLVLAAAVTSRGNDRLLMDTSLVDTLYFDSVHAFGQFGSIKVPVRFRIQSPMGGIGLALRVNSTDITIDSLSFVGGYLESYLPNGFESHGTSLTAYCTPYTGWIPAGSGKIGDLYLSFSPTITDQLVVIDTATLVLQVTFRTQFIDTLSQAHVPQVKRGYIDVTAGTCCAGIRGNVNHAPEDIIDILDLTYLVGFMFKGGSVPPCMEEANINGSANEVVDISDLTYLVSYMFKNGPAPAVCP